MEVIRHLLSRKLLTFIGATILLQLLVVSVGLYLRWTAPQFEVSAMTFDDAGIEEPFIEPLRTGESAEILTFSDAESGEFEEGIQELHSTVSGAPDTDRHVSIISYTIRSGDTLSKLWQKYAGTTEGAFKAADAFKAAGVSLRSLRVGTTVELQVAGSDITGFRMELPNGDVVMLDGSSEAGYSGVLEKAEIIEEEKVVSGKIMNSFSLAAQRNEVPYALVDQLVDIFGSKIEFRRDVQPGDSFTVMYTERRLENGKILEPGPIKAASFQNHGRWLAAVRHIDSEGTEHYYDSNGRPMGSFFLRYPLSFTRISSVFDKSRFHPVLKRTRPHNGVDFAAPVGTPVRSVADGVITIAGYRGGAGNMVKIAHGSKYATAYLHLHKISKGIRSGVKVKRGQVIGSVGQTGLATGPHLHYSFYVNGQYVDPLKVALPEVPDEYEAIPVRYLEDVLETLKSSHRELQLALEDTGQQPVG